MKYFFLSILLVWPLWVMAQNFEIGQISTTINDPGRSNRSIGVEIFYPANTAGQNVPVAAGDFPVISFGHGFTMDYDAYGNVWERVVPEGYIIALATTETGFSPSHSNFGADLSYIINWFLQQDTISTSPFFNCISGKSLVMGHSMGGGASFLAAAQNPNITAIAGFAPAETNPSAITAAENLSIPALIFIGGQDNVTPGPDHQIPMYNALLSDCKTRVTIDDAAHCRFANANTLCQLGETAVCIGCNFLDRATHHQIQFQVLIPFMDFYLKGDCTAWGTWQNMLSNPSGYSVVNSCNYTLPSTSIQVTGNSALCAVDTTYLQASGTGTFNWSTGETGANINITAPGTYKVTITDGVGCTGVDSVTITASNLVLPVINSSLGESFCIGDTTTLSVPVEYATYSWSNGDTTETVLAGNGGTYVLTVTAANGCSATSDTFLLEVNSSTAQPVLNYQNDSLFASGGTVVSWLFNGMPISGYTGSYLYPVTPGDYTLVASDSNGCQASSVVLTVEDDPTNSVAITPQLEWTLFPNPVSKKLTISYNAPIASVKVFNFIGQEVFPPQQLRLNGRIVDFSDQPQNTYFIQLESNGKRYIRKVFVQH